LVLVVISCFGVATYNSWMHSSEYQSHCLG